MLYDRARLGSDACDMQRMNIHNDRIRKQSQMITDASSQSIVSTMDRFVKAVNEMNTQVILPTKLMDVEESPSDDVPVMLRGRGGNTRYDFYQCLNVIKKDLVLGLASNDEDSDDDSPPNSRASPQKVFTTSSIPLQNAMCPTRRHSTAGIADPRPQLSDNLPRRKISLNTPKLLAREQYSQENNTAVNIGPRQDSWASLNPIHEQQQPSRRKSGLPFVNTIPEQQQPSRRKSGLAAINMRPEYHVQVSYDSGAECDDDVADVMTPGELADKLREHLQGLQIGLNHLTNTANYITKSIE